MNQPEVKQGEWIKIKSDENSQGINGHVFTILPSGTLLVGYYQNNAKAIQEEVVWCGSFWKFKYDGPNGSYITGTPAELVKRGPYK